MALKADGAVTVWGANDYGQLNVPAGLSNVVAIAGYSTFVALKEDGTVVAWGAGMTNTGSGQNWGQGIVPAGLRDVKSIAINGRHCMALVQVPPVILCATNKTVYEGTAWEFDPPAALDGCTGSSLPVTTLCTVTNGVSPQVITRTWVATNQCNALIATCSQSVTVLDLTPAISTQPQSQNIIAAQDGYFWVTATGLEPLSFQWWFNGGVIAGATNNTYTRTNAQPAHAGTYFVVVTNSLGAVTSAPAMLTVSSDAALSFDGGDRVIIGDTPALNPSCITVETWVNFGSLVSGSAQFLICKGGDRTSGAYRLLQSGSDIGFSIGHYLNGWGTSRTVSLTTNRWYHMAGTY